MENDAVVAANLAVLEEKGWVVLPGALSPEETESCRVALNQARANGWEEGLNRVGNMWFDCLPRCPRSLRPW